MSTPLSLLSMLLLVAPMPGSGSPPGCTPVPTGLIGWWAAENEALDRVGTNHGILVNGVNFTAGEVGMGFLLDGVNDFIRVPDSATLDLTNELTVELWYRSDRESGGEPLFDKRNGSNSCNYGAILSITYGIEVFYQDPLVSGGDYPTSGWEISAVPPPLPPASVFHHFAATYRQLAASNVEINTFVDGVLLRTRTMPGLLSRTVNELPLCFGTEGNGAGAMFKGVIDEVSLYSRALTSNEIAAIHQAGTAGKCFEPKAPVIVVHPENVEATNGTTAVFSVSAEGSLPIRYQWFFNGTALPAGTNATLTLINVQTNQAGAYWVSVSNVAGSANSVVAMLRVVVPTAPVCAPVPSGVVSWWAGESNGLDSAGSEHATLANGVSFRPGQVGTAFDFDGVNDYAFVAASTNLDVGLGAGLTVEAWIKPSDISQLRPIVEWNNGAGGIGTLFWISVPTATSGGPGSLFGSIADLSGGSHQISTAPGLLNTNSFHHVALTYDRASGVTALYLNGVAVKQETLGSFQPQTSFPLYLGLRPSGPFSNIYFRGMMDEVGLYNRALSATEIQSIFNAGTAGKCSVLRAPVIITQPASLKVTNGATAVFSVSAEGSLPLTYQWYFNGTPLVAGTNAMLTLANVQTNQAGAYWVSVSNVAGSANSIVATLSVIVPPVPGCVPRPLGMISWWAAEGNALDAVGSNHGILMNNVEFAPGKVGLGFQLDGTSQFVRIPDSASLDLTNELTVELWYRSTRESGGEPLFDKRSGSSSCNYGAILSITYGVEVYYQDPQVSGGDYPAGGWEISAVPPPLPTVDVFHHFAATYQQVDAANVEVKTYVDGMLARTRLMPGSLARTVNNASLSIGTEGNGAGAHFQGIIDEVSLYGRALSANEIVAVYQAGSAGKCLEPTPPIILGQPQDVLGRVGSDVVLRVTAAGTPPLSYQWRKEGQPIVGQTGPVLMLTNIQVADAGSYSAVVSNALGSVVSSNATVEVLPNPVVIGPSGIAANGFVLTFIPEKGWTNEVQASTNLIQWTSLTNIWPSDSTRVVYRDGSATNYPSRFYRVFVR